MVHVPPAPAAALRGELWSKRRFTANKTPHMKKMIFTAALVFCSMSIGAQAQSVESQALTTTSTQHEEPTASSAKLPSARRATTSSASPKLHHVTEAIMVVALPPTTLGCWS